MITRKYVYIISAVLVLIIFYLAVLPLVHNRLAVKMLAKAADLSDQRRFKKAAECYDIVVTRYFKTRYREETLEKLIGLLETSVFDRKELAGQYERYLKLYPKGRLAPAAMFSLGFHFQHFIPDFRKSEKAYLALLSKYQGDQNAYRGFSGLLELYSSQNRHSEVLKLYDKWSQVFPQSREDDNIRIFNIEAAWYKGDLNRSAQEIGLIKNRQAEVFKYNSIYHKTLIKLAK